MQMLAEWGPFVLVSVVALLTLTHLGSAPKLRLVRDILIAGAAMRIVGTLARHYMIFDIYEGGSDAVGYFSAGEVIARHFRELDFSVIGSGQLGQREWGTQAVRYAAGLVMTFVGPSMRGTFLVFSLTAFAGLVCAVVAYGRANSRDSMRQAALLLFFWPTLWFWPSSIGKEAVLLLAVGLVTLGYVGHRGRIQWLPITSGLAIAFAIRPHLAGVLAVSACVAEWTSVRWTPQRFGQAILTSALTLWLVMKAFTLLGVESSSYESIHSFMMHSAAQTNQGGSAFERTGPQFAVPMAFLNILLRPFVTEAHGALALASSLEMVMFWLLVARNLQRIRQTVRSWGTNRFVRFAVLFMVLYILMIGLTFQNLGIIARQRTLVMPMLLLVLAAVPKVQVRSFRSKPVRRLWRPTSPAPSPSSIGS